MSVDYDLVCKNHQELVSICSDGFSGPLSQCNRSLAAFVITHRNCILSVADENDPIPPQDDDEDETYKEWNLENWEKLLRYDL